MSKPLTESLKKGAFAWNESADQVFASLKDDLMSWPVLVIHDFIIPFVV